MNSRLFRTLIAALVLTCAARIVTSAQGNKVFTTDSTGHFYAPFLTPGLYSVKVELAGFSAAEQKNIEVRLGQWSGCFRSYCVLAF